MSFEQLKEAILAEAEARVLQIDTEAAQAQRQEEQRIAQAAREIEEKMISSAHAEGQTAASRLQQERQLKAKSAVLTAKQTELAATQKTAADRLLNQDDAEVKELLERLLRLVPEEGEIIAGEKHRQVIEKLVNGERLAEETIPNDGGFIYRAPKTEINLTIRYLMAQVFARHRAELARILFS